MNTTQLEKFEPFYDLDEQSKLVAINRIAVERHRKDAILFDVGNQDQFEYFLLDGEVELIAADGMKKKIHAEDNAARFTLALLRPRKYRAIVTSNNAELISIDMLVLQNLRKSIPVAGDAFTSFSSFTDESSFEEVRTDADAIKKFLVDASTSIKENRLVISNFDNVSQTVFNVIKDPNVDIDTVVSAVQLDVAITAKLVKAANSAFFGGMSPVESARAAIVRLGLALTIQLISIMVMKEVFDSRKEHLNEAMEKLWFSSLNLASYAVVVGRKSDINLSQGQILLASLMNDIGSLVMIAYLDQYPVTKKSVSEQVLVSDIIKKKLGKDLLKHWNFSNTIIETIKLSDELERDINEPDISDVITVAKQLLRSCSYRMNTGDLDFSEIPSCLRLGLNVENPVFIQNLAEEAKKYAELFVGVSN